MRQDGSFLTSDYSYYSSTTEMLGWPTLELSETLLRILEIVHITQNYNRTSTLVIQPTTQ